MSIHSQAALDRSFHALGDGTRREILSMSPGTNPISFSSRADSCDNALRVTRALFQFANSLSIFVINFTIILRGFVKVLVRYVSENAIDLISLFECDAGIT